MPNDTPGTTTARRICVGDLHVPFRELTLSNGERLRLYDTTGTPLLVWLSFAGLLVAVGLSPSVGEVPPHQLGIDVQEGEPDVAGEGEVGVPIAAVEIIIENATNAARHEHHHEQRGDRAEREQEDEMEHESLG